MNNRRKSAPPEAPPHMSPRSILKMATRRHTDPSRKGEVIVEVWRDNQLVAHVYGSREGVHVVSQRVDPDGINRPFLLTVPGVAPVPGVVVPLLAFGEVCPWCQGSRVVNIGVDEGVPTRCPVCSSPRGATLTINMQGI